MTKAEKRVIEAALEWDEIVRDYRWEVEMLLAQSVGVLLNERRKKPQQGNRKRTTYRSRKGKP